MVKFALFSLSLSPKKAEIQTYYTDIHAHLTKGKLIASQFLCF